MKNFSKALRLILLLQSLLLFQTKLQAQNQAVTNFILLNADSNQDIKILADGEVINLSLLPTKNIGIRANTNPSVVGSVVFSKNGVQKTENFAPYVYHGDNNGNYFPWVPAVGSYTVTATPYSGYGGSGSKGTTLSISFTVVNTNTTNQLPVVQAGADMTINLPTNSAQLRGSASDADDGISSYSWSQVSGPNTASLKSPNSAITSVDNLIEGSYIFRLSATDKQGGSAFDQVQITVTSYNNTCAATGTILREYWANVSGRTLADIPVNSTPTSTSQLTIFETATNSLDNYGHRIRGYICAPVTGNYIFYIASDDHSELWLSTDATPDNKKKIASVDGWTLSREWAKYSSQQSESVSLQAGQKYYIEALHKDGTGWDNLAVGWQLPDGTLERPITGSRLSPYVTDAPSNQVPVLANAIADQSIAAGEAFSLSFSENTFTDADGDVLSYTASLASGASLPSWLLFNNSTRTFSGTPASNNPTSFTVKVIAGDGKGSTASDEFVINITNKTSQQAVYRINAGGSQVSNSLGLFSADQYYTPLPGFTYTNAVPITNTNNAAIYQTERSASENNGTFSYAFPVSSGKYAITLHFAELYWNNIGERIFDVSIEGNKVLNNFDIVKKVGSRVATTESFTADVTDGTLNIYFSALSGDGGVNRPKVSAIEVIKLNNSSTNLPPVVQAGTDQTVTLPTASVSLQGSASDADGSISSYSWSQVSGPNTASLKSPGSATASVDNLIEGSYVFRLTATDNQGATAVDEIKVTVNKNTTDSPATVVVSGELKKWHKVSLTFTGPSTSESNTQNPFLNYRLNVTFTKGNRQVVVPGYYAADGNAAETSASAGDKWKVHFSPDEEGTWSYKASFRTGANIAIDENATAGSPVAFDGSTGTITIGATDKTGSDLRAKGRLQYVNGHYLQFAQTGEYFLKGGVDSPENFLAYMDFDGTYSHGSTSYIKSYTPHINDWKQNDPTWKNGKGKGIIGSLNYLASKGMNSVYFLTMNVNGDGKDVWPWISHTERYRFDVSKLDQWEIVFSHMDKNGLMLHVVTQEIENDKLLDGGELGVQRKLYYRELIARFGHHLGINWNLGEENSNTDAQRKAFASYIKRIDPYNSFVNVHTWPDQQSLVYTPLLGFSFFDGVSLQLANTSSVHSETLKWINQSASNGRKWVVNLDEIGPADVGVKPDADDYWHNQVRKEALWGNLMAGGGGVEWYFGYAYPNSDLTAQDWRSRDNMWNLTRYALEFFQNHLPYWEMKTNNGLTSVSNDYCFALPGKIYAIYLPNGGSTSLNLGSSTASYQVKWYNPRTGGALQNGSIGQINGSGNQSVGNPPSDFSNDWVCLVTNTNANARVDLANTQEDAINATVMLHPNPAYNQTTLEVNLPEEMAMEILITDMTGRPMASAINTVAKSYTKQLDLSSYKPGVYFIQVKYGNVQVTQRLIKF